MRGYGREKSELWLLGQCAPANPLLLTFATLGIGKRCLLGLATGATWVGGRGGFTS